MELSLKLYHARMLPLGRQQLITEGPAANDLLGRWKEIGNHPPPYAAADGEYFSLADMFQMLAGSLARLHRGGSVPESIRLVTVYGPLEMPDDQGPSEGTVKIADLARTCSELSDRLNSQAWTPVPENAIPGRITVGGIQLNAAQFLRLMAEAIESPAEGELKVRTCQMFSSAGQIFPTTRPRSDMGSVWTLKPVRLRPAASH